MGNGNRIDEITSPSAKGTPSASGGSTIATRRTLTVGEGETVESLCLQAYGRQPPKFQRQFKTWLLQQYGGQMPRPGQTLVLPLVSDMPALANAAAPRLEEKQRADRNAALSRAAQRKPSDRFHGTGCPTCKVRDKGQAAVKVTSTVGPLPGAPAMPRATGVGGRGSPTVKPGASTTKPEFQSSGRVRKVAAAAASPVDPGELAALTKRMVAELKNRSPKHLRSSETLMAGVAELLAMDPGIGRLLNAIEGESRHAGASRPLAAAAAVAGTMAPGIGAVLSGLAAAGTLAGSGDLVRDSSTQALAGYVEAGLAAGLRELGQDPTKAPWVPFSEKVDQVVSLLMTRFYDIQIRGTVQSHISKCVNRELLRVDPVAESEQVRQAEAALLLALPRAQARAHCAELGLGDRADNLLGREGSAPPTPQALAAQLGILAQQRQSELEEVNREMSSAILKVEELPPVVIERALAPKLRSFGLDPGEFPYEGDGSTTLRKAITAGGMSSAAAGLASQAVKVVSRAADGEVLAANVIDKFINSYADSLRDDGLVKGGVMTRAEAAAEGLRRRQAIAVEAVFEAAVDSDWLKGEAAKIAGPKLMHAIDLATERLGKDLMDLAKDEVTGRALNWLNENATSPLIDAGAEEIAAQLERHLRRGGPRDADPAIAKLRHDIETARDIYQGGNHHVRPII